jgi:hypothetical protein
MRMAFVTVMCFVRLELELAGGDHTRGQPAKPLKSSCRQVAANSTLLSMAHSNHCSGPDYKTGCLGRAIALTKVRDSSLVWVPTFNGSCFPRAGPGLTPCPLRPEVGTTLAITSLTLRPL